MSAWARMRYARRSLAPNPEDRHPPRHPNGRQPPPPLGRADRGRLKARRSLSFARYHDPARMGCGALGVWDNDGFAPGHGFDLHPHRDMEIVPYVREGAITHRDSLGNESRTEAGDVQDMSAGTGVVHGEGNLEDETARIFQIWIPPRRPGVPPPTLRPGLPRLPQGRPRRRHRRAGFRPPQGPGGRRPLHRRRRRRAGRDPVRRRARHPAHHPRARALPRAAARPDPRRRPEGRPRDGIAARNEAQTIVEALEESEILATDVRARRRGGNR